MEKQISVKDIGAGMKSVNMEYWGGIEGFLAATSNGEGGTATVQQLRRVVPWLAKATDMTSNAVSELPFDIVNDKGDVVDSSKDWKNLVGGIDQPDHLFGLLAASLCLGRAYLIKQSTNRVIVSLQYCAPHTVNPYIDQTGLRYFDRTTDKGKTERYLPAGTNSKQDREMMYFWLQDSDVEIGPALSYPAGSATMAAQLLFSMDGSIQSYADSGFIQPTILGMKGMPAPAEKEKTETWWDNFLRGRTKQRAKIFNAEAMTVNQLGAGMKDFSGSYGELNKQAIENIGTAFGIPAALFMSDMAFASEVNPMIKVWYSTSVFVKIYKAIENTFNTQLLNKFGYELKFRPENLDSFKDDQSNNATTFGVYVDKGIKPSIAAQMAGLKLPEGIEYEDLDPEETEEPIMPIAPIVPIAQPVEDDTEDEDLQPEMQPVNAKQIKELNLWRQISERCYRKSKGVAADFECKELSDTMASGIRKRLLSAKSLDDISAAFELGSDTVEPKYNRNYDNDGLKALASAINAAALAEQTKHVVVNNYIPEHKTQITNQIPEVGAPGVTINIPEQPAPVVNVTTPEVKVVNEVNPTPVTIENTVNLPEEKAEKLTVTRDAKGNITGMVKK